MIQIRSLHKRYPDAHTEVLRGIELDIDSGELVSLVGRSGCGKTTLLNIIGGLDDAYDGVVDVGGARLAGLSDRELARYRRRSVGFVFQAYHLLEHLSCVENVALAARFGRNSGREARTRALEVLQLVGLSGAADRRPIRLSGGEQQRVAIARALFNRPGMLLLDEPTGNLDTDTGAEILGLLSELHQSQRLTIVAATHDPSIAAAGHRRLTMTDGRIVDSDATER